MTNQEKKAAAQAAAQERKAAQAAAREQAAAAQAAAAQAAAAQETVTPQVETVTPQVEPIDDFVKEIEERSKKVTKEVTTTKGNLVTELKKGVEEAKSLSKRFKDLCIHYQKTSIVEKNGELVEQSLVKAQINEWMDEKVKINPVAVQRILVQQDFSLFRNFLTEKQAGNTDKKTFTENEAIAILKRSITAKNEDISAFDASRSIA